MYIVIAGGLILVIALLGMIGCTIKIVWPIHRVAAYLLIPYLAWILFATVLNVAIVVLN
jgi:tryptophan-rich sensory protein